MKDLAKRYKNDAERIKNIRESFWERYPEIFNDSSENEVESNIDEGKTRPKKPNLGEIKERLLRNRTTEAFADYHGVQYDPNLTLVERMIKLQKAIDDATRRKIHYASLLGELLQSCFSCVSVGNAFKTILKTNKSVLRWYFQYILLGQPVCCALIEGGGKTMKVLMGCKVVSLYTPYTSITTKIIFYTSLKLDRFTTKTNSKSNPKVMKPVGP